MNYKKNVSLNLNILKLMDYAVTRYTEIKKPVILFENDIKPFGCTMRQLVANKDKIRSCEAFDCVDITNNHLRISLRPELIHHAENAAKYCDYGINLTNRYAYVLYNTMLFCMGTRKQSYCMEEYPVETLKEHLGAAGKAYERYNNLSQTILKPAIKEIAEKTNMTISMFPIKQGVNIVNVQLYAEREHWFRPKREVLISWDYESAVWVATSTLLGQSIASKSYDELISERIPELLKKKEMSITSFNIITSERQIVV